MRKKRYVCVCVRESLRKRVVYTEVTKKGKTENILGEMKIFKQMWAKIRKRNKVSEKERERKGGIK